MVFCRKVVLTNLAKFTKRTCALNEVVDLQRLTLSKRDSSTGVFLWFFWNFLRAFFYRTSSNCCFCLITHSVYCPTTTSRFKYISLYSSLRTMLWWGMRCWRSDDFFVKDFFPLTFSLLTFFWRGIAVLWSWLFPKALFFTFIQQTHLT